VPTSDRPAITPSRPGANITSDLPVVVAARKIKEQKRRKAIKIGVLVVVVLSVAVVAISLLLTNTETPVEPADTQSEKDIQPKMSGRNADEPLGFDFNGDIKDQLVNLGKSSALIGMKLYKEEIKKNTGNLLFSPFSIQTALSMASLGSRGNTLDELMGFFSGAPNGEGLIRDLTTMKTLFGSALPKFHSNENFTIETANSMFVQEDYNILGDLVTDLGKYFETSITSTNYSKPQSAADLINHWVEEKTRNKIRNLVPAEAINQDTKIVLVNALYFKGLWLNVFDKKQTRKGTFHISDTQTVETDFMHQRKELKIGSFRENTIVALPYAGDRFVMYLFVPHKISDLDGFSMEETEKNTDEPLSVLENVLVSDPEGLSDALDIEKFEDIKVDLLIPKFKIEASMGLKENLEKLGVKAPFSIHDADFSGISGERDLFISDALHKAFLEVNEEGSEAAAATAIMFATRMLMPDPPAMHFDRPFVFFIKDELTGVVLFQGRVVEPTQ